jgi:serine/threonine protein phosphatase PrpC
MEDDHIAEQIDIDGVEKGMLFAVFDGHGGKDVAIYAKERFVDIFKAHKEFKAKNFAKALTETFILVDAEIKKKDYGADTGATSVVVFVTN